MPIIILIPTAICILALYRVSVQKIFLNLFLPIFIVCPNYYYWKVAALPPVDLTESVLFPLGIAMLFTERKRWRFSFVDAFVAIFIFSCFYADLTLGKQTTSIFEFFTALCHILVPYMCGKLLIEHNGLRVAVVRRIVFCLFLAGVISAYEYKMGQNPFTLMTARFFPGEVFNWHTSIRWGFGRVSGPYGQSELAGMIFFFGLVLALWLVYNKHWEPKFNHAPWFPFKKSSVITFVIAFTLLMTQARGPWIGALAALPIALIGRAKHVLRTAVITGLCFLVFGAIGVVGLKSYASVSARTESNEQENAQYRTALFDHYWPIAKQGGPFGWGVDFPRIAGQGSIDNEYLFVGLVQGMVGLAAFFGIAFGTVYNAAMAAIYNPTKDDRYFGFSLLGIQIGLMITIGTVFLGNQSYEIFYLLAGWSQAIRIRRSTQPHVVFQQALT